MTFWIAAALLAALAVGAITGPLWQRHKKLGVALACLAPILALLLYLLTGNPGFTE